MNTADRDPIFILWGIDNKKEAEQLQKDFMFLCGLNSNIDAMLIFNRKIVINNYICIRFYPNDADKCAGLKPDYVLTNNSEVETYMRYRGAKPLGSFVDIFRIIEKGE